MSKGKRTIEKQLIKPVKGKNNLKGREDLFEIEKEHLKELNVPFVDDCCDINPDAELPVGYNYDNEQLKFYNPTTKLWELVPVSGGGAGDIPEILYSAIALSGDAGVYKLGINYVTGVIYYVNADNDWVELDLNGGGDTSEIFYNAGPLSGSVGTYLIGVDTVNETIYYSNGGTWELLPMGGTLSAAGTNGQIQFNSAGVFGADSNVAWDNTNKRLFIGGTGTLASTTLDNIITPKRVRCVGVNFDNNTSIFTGFSRSSNSWSVDFYGYGTSNSQLIANLGGVGSTFHCIGTRFIDISPSQHSTLFKVTTSFISAPGDLGVADTRIFDIQPTINVTDAYSPNFIGWYYNPTVTNLNGGEHVAIHTVSGKIRHGDLAGTGDRQVVASSTGELKTVVTPTEYIAKIEQTGTNVLDILSVLKNTIEVGGVGLSFSYVGQGSYLLTASSPIFDVNKTVVEVTNPFMFNNTLGESVGVMVGVVSSTQIAISSFKASDGEAIDDVIGQEVIQFLKITNYP